MGCDSKDFCYFLMRHFLDDGHFEYLSVTIGQRIHSRYQFCHSRQWLFISWDRFLWQFFFREH